MKFNVHEWIGNWDNFESYIYSESEPMKICWAEAEEAVKAIPSPMFKNGAKGFWQTACSTVTAKNPVRLGGWKITEAENGMHIVWLDETGNSLGEADYAVSDILPKGLEGKENFLFEAADAPDGFPFRCLLAMEPMPERAAVRDGGLLSHLHFQYSDCLCNLLQAGKLVSPMWYATMCAADGGELERCNIVRALHRMPKWEKLP